MANSKPPSWAKYTVVAINVKGENWAKKHKSNPLPTVYFEKWTDANSYARKLEKNAVKGQLFRVKELPTAMFVVKELLTYNSWMIVKRCPTIQQARKHAYVSLKEDRYPVDIFDENDNLVGYVVTHRPGADAPVYFHPNHNNKYFIKHPLKFNKYILNRDGSLGKGEM